MNLARSDVNLRDWSLHCLTSDFIDTFITGIIFFQLLLELNPLCLPFCCFWYNQAKRAYFMQKSIMLKNKHQINFLLFHLSLSGSGLRNKQMKTGKWLTCFFSGWKVRVNQISNSFYTASLELLWGFGHFFVVVVLTEISPCKMPLLFCECIARHCWFVPGQ